MLANQVSVPEVQVSQDSVKAHEIKASHDNSGDKGFAQIMQNGKREQQIDRKEQQIDRRQSDAKEANHANSVAKKEVEQADIKQKSARKDELENQADEVASKQRKQDENADNYAKEQNASADEKAAGKNADDNTQADDGQLETQLRSAEKNETSKWLDTILTIASDDGAEASSTDSEGETNTKDGQGEFGLSLENKVSLLLVKQVLANSNSDADLSQLEGHEEVSLAQLEAMLSDSDFKAVLVQLEQNSQEVTPEQEFEQLLAQLSKGNVSETDKDKPAAETKNSPELSLQSKLQDEQKTAAQSVVNAKQEAEVTPKVTSVVANQSDKMVAEKSERFKQSNLMSAMQLANQQSLDSKNSETIAKPSISDLLAPTTKVVDFGGPAEMSTDANKAMNTNMIAAATQSMSEQNSESKTSFSAADMLDVKTKESGDIKLPGLLAQLGAEDVKTTDVLAKAEKVNVAGVTIDKTLQMPKLENMAQAKSEVMIRENILFNKQELANQMQTQVGLMMARNMKSVDIRLDPPELGSMQVKLSVQNDQASVSFVVSSSQAKDALENSLPKLKELLEQQGLDLADSDVHQEQSQNQADNDDEKEIAKNSLNSEGENTDDELEQQQQMLNRAINSPWNVSYYA